MHEEPNNFRINRENDYILYDHFYTMGDWQDIRLTSYTLKNGDKVSFIAEISQAGIKPIPLFYASNAVYYLFNGSNSANDILNISKQKVRAIFANNNSNWPCKFLICLIVLLCSGYLSARSILLTYRYIMAK